MFTPIHLLPRYNHSEAVRFRSRWENDSGRELEGKILSKIREGAGEDFLQSDFERGELGFLESIWDLKGIKIFNEDIVFPTGDNFEAINFSYAEFSHSKFHNACFYSTYFSFTRFFGCEFHNCLFAFSSFYAASIENVKFINCDFVEYNSFVNCVFREVVFRDWYTSTNIFSDCQFDANTEITTPSRTPISRFGSGPFDVKRFAEIFNAIKEAYRAGGVIPKSRKYLFRQRQCSTRYNTELLFPRIVGYIEEYLTGYGLRPVRVLIAMAAFFFIFLLLFSAQVGASDALILTAGAFFTFGGNTDLLRGLGPVYKVLYILSSFAGISFTALFITVLANVWFKEQ